MTQHIQVKEYKTTADLMADAKARRAKFFPPQPIKKAMTYADLERIENERKAIEVKRIRMSWPEPERPDYHMHLYRQHLAFIRAPIKKFMRDYMITNGWRQEILFGPRRFAKIAHARQELMYLVKTAFPDASYPEIGRLFGGMDHTTIIHGIAAHKRRSGL